MCHMAYINVDVSLQSLHKFCLLLYTVAEKNHPFLLEEF